LLDPASAGRVADLLSQLNREQGVTLIVVTHHTAFARGIGRTLELLNGKLKEADP
jgi:predicted ABC-type transport system involved in lysophospholipase L1 biosynthesis ATPase subunit